MAIFYFEMIDLGINFIKINMLWKYASI